MSLQVWLPLNGNLSNQGLSDVTVVNNGATVDSNGKIGSCYLFNSAKLSISPSFITSFSGDFSFSIWLYVNSFTTAWETYFQVGLGTAPWASYTIGLLRNNTNSQVVFCISDGSSSTQNNCYTSVSTGTWYHFAGTYSKSESKIRLYKNGELVSTFNTSIVPNFSSVSKITLGQVDNGNYKTNCLINDFRIYDHCLSSKEIKEISKGLICHYKLNGKGFGNPNLIEDSSFLNNGTTGSVYRDSSKLFNGKPTLKITRSGATELTYTGWSRTVTNVKAGDTIYASAWVYVEDISTLDYGCEWRVYQTHNDGSANNWNGWYSSSLFKEGRWVKVGRSYTLDSNLSSAVFNMNVVRNGTYWIAEPKVEFGSVPTPWCPHTSDTFYTSLGLNSTTESDNSGYKYDGTLSESLSLASGSPRYGECYYFNSTSKRITLPTINMTGFANSFSISWWGKAPSYLGLMYWGFSNGNRLNYYDGKYCNTGDGGSNPYYKPNTTTTIDVPSVNAWHHFVMVGDGSTNKLYMDGALYGVAKTYKGITGSTIVINGWDSSTQYKTNGYISDFRIYSTALSASDIKELYNTSASVDKNGNMYAYEFKEE